MCDNEYDENFKTEMEDNYIMHWNYRNLKSFPELLRFSGKHIIDLYLKGNCISTVPEWITEMENLSEIHLTSNKLTQLPEEISKLKRLSVLDVSDNQIVELPKSITFLAGLMYLDASRNLLIQLPKEIGRLKALSHLDVSRNQISKIPCSITGCSSLREINLSDNNLTSIPRSMVYMPNLELICVNQNKLFYLPVISFLTTYVTILAQKNENLNHISRQVENLNNEWLHAKLDVSTEVYERKNFNGLKHQLSPDYSIICTEKTDLVIPMRVYHEKETPVPTLLELCLRAADKLIFTNRRARRTESQKLRDQLPNRVCDEFENGPTAWCLKCHTGLFKFAFVRILWDEKRPRLAIIEYFCTAKCLELFKMECTTLWPEIKWKRL